MKTQAFDNQPRFISTDLVEHFDLPEHLLLSNRVPPGFRETVCGSCLLLQKGLVKHDTVNSSDRCTISTPDGEFVPLTGASVKYQNIVDQ